MLTKSIVKCVSLRGSLAGERKENIPPLSGRVVRDFHFGTQPRASIHQIAFLRSRQRPFRRSMDGRIITTNDSAMRQPAQARPRPASENPDRKSVVYGKR